MEPSHSYLKTGLQVAALTAILFTRFDVLAFPLLGLTCGLATRNVWRALAGLIISAASGAFFLTLSVGSSRNIIFTLPGGLFNSGGLAHFIMPLLGSCIGAVIALPQQRLVLFACALALLSILNLMCASYLFIHFFPGQSFGPRTWEYATLLASVPAIGGGIWGPLDLISQKQFKHCETSLDYLEALKKSF